jgi:hypothetical protein
VVQADSNTENKPENKNNQELEEMKKALAEEKNRSEDPATQG